MEDDLREALNLITDITTQYQEEIVKDFNKFTQGKRI